MPPTGERGLTLGRAGLPDALRVLLRDLPRETWEAHPEFGALTRFWLDRHLMFRRLTGLLRPEAEAALDGSMAPETHAQRVSRLGGMLYGDLHAHHRIEDVQFFPVLQALELRLARGFDLLEADHAEMDQHLRGFAEAANAVIRAAGEAVETRDAVAAFLGTVTGLEALLDRHLADEEDLIVPVILRHGEGVLGP